MARRTSRPGVTAEGGGGRDPSGPWLLPVDGLSSQWVQHCCSGARGQALAAQGQRASRKAWLGRAGRGRVEGRLLL